ncbi:hypothetical protein GTP58_15920 [Duganella sp. CY15W]|uniref:hypothetical protein n=1 Tax=Duganella sp. CY15W TaxID=2692172 RepID=UPI001368354B|nr:hypothetical protein [Duganella sp. CY15W]MYM29819.1 hypothetical protein [Duganella sp. CY15W]
METEQRFEKQEAFADDAKQRLVRIEMRLDGIELRMTTSMATKEDIASLRADIYQLEVRMVKWFIFAAFGMTTVMGGVAVAAIRLMH